MARSFVAVGVGASLVLWLVAAPAHAAAGAGGMAGVEAGHTATALAVFSDRVVLREARAEVRAWGGSVRRCFEAGRVCVFDFPAAAFPRGVPWARLRALPGVESLEPDALMDGQAQTFPDAGGTSDCSEGFWELDVLGLPSLWDYADGSQAPHVMVCDGGFLTTHQDLQGAFSAGWDYGNDDPEVEVEWDVGVPAHGTFISGLLAATPDNGVGRVGVLPYGKVYPAKIADSGGHFSFSNTIAALADAAEDPSIRVVSYSLTSKSYSDAYAAAVAGLAAHDTLLVAAAGNCSLFICPNANNDSFPQYPGGYPGEHVLQVGGVKPGDTWNSYSHYGVETVDLAAPGVDLCSLGVDDDADTYTASGTSYAAPLVAGVAALLMEANPLMTSLEVAEDLELTAFRNDELATKVTYGRVDGAAALAMPWVTLGQPVAPGSLTAQAPPSPAASLTLPLANRGGAGDVWLLVGHEPGVTLGAPLDEGGSPWPGWSAQAYAAGDPVPLPAGLDAPALWTAPQAVTVLEGPVERHGQRLLQVPVSVAQPGSSLLTVGGLATSVYGHQRAVVPAGEGEADALGQPAREVTLTASAAPAPGPEPGPEPAPELAPELGAEPAPEASSDAAGHEVVGADASPTDEGPWDVPHDAPGSEGWADGVGSPRLDAGVGTSAHGPGSTGPSGCQGAASRGLAGGVALALALLLWALARRVARARVSRG